MNVEFKTDLNDYDILFGADFPAAPRVGEIVWSFEDVNKRYRVVAVEYGILNPTGSNVGAICTVEEAEGRNEG